MTEMQPPITVLKIKIRNWNRKIKKLLDFKKTFNLAHRPGNLDLIPKKKLVEEITKIIKKIKPDEIFVPSNSDVHSDHKVTSEIISTCTKNFRFKFIKTVLAYEVLSKSNFNLIKKNNFF